MNFPLPRADLATPALLLDVAAMDRNIAAMTAFARARGLALRPHAKTHKSGEIARRQIARRPMRSARCTWATSSISSTPAH